MTSLLTTSEAIKRLKKGSIEALMLRVAGVGSLLLMNVTAARLLGVEGYGVFSYSIAIASVLAIAIPLGWPTALMRFAAQYVQEEAWGHLKGILALSHSMTLVPALFCGIIVYVLSVSLDLAPEMALSLKYSAFILVLASFGVLRKRLFVGLQMVKTSIAMDEIILPVLFITFMLILQIDTSSAALKIYLAASFAVLLAGFVCLVKGLPREVLVSKPEYLGRYWLSIAFPMMLGGMSRLLLSRMDILMLGWMTDLNTVGLYSAANRISMLNVFLLISINAIAPPLLASLYHSNNLDAFKTVLKRVAFWSTLGTLPLFVFLVMFPRFVLGFFGGEFEAGSTLLIILSAGQFVNAMTGSAGSALLMTGRERKILYSTSVVTIFNIIGNYIFIKSHGAIGAASVTAVSIVILSVWQLAYVVGFIRRGIGKTSGSGEV
jgi:O-antigen/teichoic acid export membrane protein